MSLNIHRMINILHFNRHYSQQCVFHTFCSEFGQSFLYYNMQTVLELESRIFEGRRSALICIDITVESWRGTNEVDDGQWPSGNEVNAAQALGVNALQRAPTEKKYFLIHTQCAKHFLLSMSINWQDEHVANHLWMNVIVGGQPSVVHHWQICATTLQCKNDLLYDQIIYFCNDD